MTCSPATKSVEMLFGQVGQSILKEEKEAVGLLSVKSKKKRRKFSLKKKKAVSS